MTGIESSFARYSGCEHETMRTQGDLMDCIVVWSQHKCKTQDEVQPLPATQGEWCKSLRAAGRETFMFRSWIVQEIAAKE